MGVPGVKLHELRHTYITMLAHSNANPRVTQYLAGHGSLQMTLEVYTHATAEDARNAVESIGVLS